MKFGEILEKYNSGELILKEDDVLFCDEKWCIPKSFLDSFSISEYLENIRKQEIKMWWGDLDNDNN